MRWKFDPVTLSFDLWPWKSIVFQILLRTKYVPSLVKIHRRMLILECSQGCDVWWRYYIPSQLRWREGNKCLPIMDTTIVFLLNKDSTWHLWSKFLDMQISSHSYHCEYLYIYLMCTLCYIKYICSIILSGFIDVWSNNIEM